MPFFNRCPSPRELRAFAGQIGKGASEHLLLEQAERLLLKQAALGDIARFRLFMRARAYTDAAIVLYRSLLPEHGFQLGGPAVGGQAVALSWRNGDCGAVSHRAATPALALLRAAAASVAAEQEHNQLKQCAECGGLGWYVTTENRKQICRHANVDQPADMQLLAAG